MVASIQSPKVVQIYDLVIASDHVALIMEYVPGCDLEEFLAHERPSLASVVAICNDIAGALAAARAQRIVHGDLKAGNILITEQGRVKLTDFGIARRGQALDHLEAAASLSCVSPEQYRGMALDVRSDLFALGCLLYRMLSGRQPFVHEGVLDAEQLLNGSPTAVGELVDESQVLPVALAELLTALLQNAPEDRPANTHQVRNVLREISREIPLSVGNTLLQEARQYFRVESPEDIPPLVPSDLTRRGRSSMPGNGFELWPGFIATRPTLLATLALLIVAGIFGSVIVQTVLGEKARVVIEAPSFNISTTAPLPEELSARWLAGEIESTVDKQFDNVSITGGLAQEQNKIYYSRELVATAGSSDKGDVLVIRSELHCVAHLCLLVFLLEKGGRQFSSQEAIFTHMPIARWQDMVQASIQALLQRSR
jgi:serine/threonine protein kinase